MVLRVLRFTGSERAVHWLTAAAFVSLLASGLPVGRSGSFHNLMYGWHLISAGALVGGILLGIAAGNRRALGGAASELVRLTADDRRWLAHAPAHLLAGDPEPDAVRRALVETLLRGGDRPTLVRMLDETILGLRPAPASRPPSIARALAG